MTGQVRDTRDHTNDCRRRMWVSIKIMTADATSSSRELRNYQSLVAKCGEQGPGSQTIVRLFDHFVHSGPNGTHQCLVFELLGPTLGMVVEEIASYDDSECRFAPETGFRISGQMLKAIAFIHEAGFGHGGKQQMGLRLFRLKFGISSF